MFVDELYLEQLGIAFSVAARERCAESDFCVLCNSPEIDERARKGDKVQWLKSHGARRTGESDLLIQTETEISGRRGSDVDVQYEISILGKSFVAESKIQPMLALSPEILERIAADMTEAEEAAIREELALPICTYCGSGDATNASFELESRYINFRYGGNALVARSQPVWPTIARLIERAKTYELEQAG